MAEYGFWSESGGVQDDDVSHRLRRVIFHGIASRCPDETDITLSPQLGWWFHGGKGFTPPFVGDRFRTNPCFRWPILIREAKPPPSLDANCPSQSRDNHLRTIVGDGVVQHGVILDSPHQWTGATNCSPLCEHPTGVRIFSVHSHVPGRGGAQKATTTRVSADGTGTSYADDCNCERCRRTGEGSDEPCGHVNAPALSQVRTLHRQSGYG